jgi:tellurite resistance protein
MPDYPTGHQNTLVDAFFFEQDQKLLKEFRARMEKMDRRTQLSQVSGIHDEAVLDRLIELDLRPETLAALEIVPLVRVAWADGSIQTHEREAIVAAAQAAGLQPQDGRYPLLELWLKKRPSAELLDAWKHYITALCQKLEAPEVEKLREGVLGLARKVAQAAGGFLGMGKVSAAERAALEELQQAFVSRAAS